MANLFKEETIPRELRESIKETIEKLKDVSQNPDPITDEDQKRIMEHLDEFFKHGDSGSGKAG